MRSKILQKILYNWQIKILCFLLAAFVYFVLIFSIQTTRHVFLPLQVTLPSSYTADSTVPSGVDLVIEGTEEQIYLIDVSRISLSADFSKVNREGVSYAAVQIDTAELDSYIDMTSISIYTKPSRVKVYFSASEK